LSARAAHLPMMSVFSAAHQVTQVCCSVFVFNSAKPNIGSYWQGG